MRDEPVPLGRLLLLRQFPPLADVDLGELAMFADNAVESRFRAGSKLTTAPALHLVIDGRIESRRGSWGPHEVFGLLEVLADRPALAPAIAAIDTRTLHLDAADTMDVLEDNFGLLHALLRDLAAKLIAHDDPPRARSTPITSDQLSLVERLIVLRQHLPFKGGPLQALAALAHLMEELTLPAGVTVVRADAVADAALIILDGSLHATRADGTSRLLHAGDTIGALETIAGQGHRSTVVTASRVRALSWSGATFLDVLEDHADLGLLMISSFARSLLSSTRY